MDSVVIAALFRSADHDSALGGRLVVELGSRFFRAVVVVAGGMARYEGDVSVAAVFDRADTAMYENKTMLKNL